MGYCKDCLWFCEIFKEQGQSLEIEFCILNRNYLTSEYQLKEHNCFEENKNSKTP